MLPPKPVRSRSSFRQAFTLVEILVVIVIIAILAALIFPALAGVQKQNRQMNSLNNLRQWGAGFMASVGDNDNEMPSDGGRTADMKDDTAWFNRIPEKLKIVPLSKATDVDLPKLGVKSVWINPEVPANTAPDGVPFCYGYNDYLSTSTEPNMRLSRVLFPAKTILMAEKTADKTPSVNPENIKAWFGANSVKVPNDPDNICNILFIDGHVEGTKLSVYSLPQTTKGSNEEDFRQVAVTWLPYIDAKKN